MELEFVSLLLANIILEQPLEHEPLSESMCRRRSKCGRLNSTDYISLIAKSEPHAAFSTFTNGLIGHWLYFLRTIEGITPLLQPLEDCNRQDFLPALNGQSSFSDLERELLALPARLGGLGLVNPTTLSAERTFSLRLTAPLTAIIVLQKGDTGDARQQQQSIKSSLHTERHKQQEEVATELKA